MAKAKISISSAAQIQVAKIPFRVDEALVKRSQLEQDVPAIALAIWRLLAKSRSSSGWGQSGIQRGVNRLGSN